MEELLILILQFVAELVVNVLSSVLDWPTIKNDRLNHASPFVTRLLWLLCGGLLGWLSTLLLHQVILGHFELRLLNIALSPFLAGLLARAIANQFGRAGTNARHHFWNAFCTSLGFALMRFAYATRG